MRVVFEALAVDIFVVVEIDGGETTTAVAKVGMFFRTTMTGSWSTGGW